KKVSVDGGTTWCDANTAATAPTLLSGNGAPKFEYIVANTGNVDLAAPTVTDDKLGSITSFTGDTNNDGKLSVGETWTYVETGPCAKGLQTNPGPADDTFGATPLHQTDPANYVGAAPGIKIVKVTVDGTYSGDAGTFLQGDSITWKYTVTNTGNVALSNVTV